MSAPHIRGDLRTGWLLAVNRLMGRDARFAQRAEFTSALSDHGIRADTSRLSRWESGASPAPLHVVAAYESILGLADGSLVAVTSGLRRTFGLSEPKVRGVAAAVHTSLDLETLLDLAHAGEATGGDWLRLTEQLVAYDRMFLRQAEWARTCEQLVRELATAAGIGYVRRYEAAATLLRHAEARGHLGQAIGRYVMNPDAQVILPVLNLLSEVDDPAASTLTLRMLQHERPSVRRAASSVAATKVARGLFAAGDLAQLEGYVIGSLRRGESLDGRLDTFDLAVHLPDESWARVSDKLRSKRAFSLVGNARATGELVATSPAVAAIRVHAGIAQAEAPAHVRLELDMMLRRLLRESLLHAHKPRRHHAALLLAASPYADAISRRCRELARETNDVLAARAWTVLMRVGVQSDHDTVVGEALAESRASIRARGLVMAGLMPGELDDDHAERIAVTVEEQTRPVAQMAGLFALGMKGSEQVKRLAAHPSEQVSRGAQWWLEQGPARHDADLL